MSASCRCRNGHVFMSKVVEDSPDINYFEVEDEVCPECGEEFEVVETEYDRLEDDVV